MHKFQSLSRPRFFRLSTEPWPPPWLAIPVLPETDSVACFAFVCFDEFGGFALSDEFVTFVRIDLVAAAAATLAVCVACVAWVVCVTSGALDAFVGLALVAWVVPVDWVARPDVDGFSLAEFGLDAYLIRKHFIYKVRFMKDEAQLVFKCCGIHTHTSVCVGPSRRRDTFNLAWFLCILTINSCCFMSLSMHNLQIVFGNGSSGEIYRNNGTSKFSSSAADRW